jgi:molybdopterin molybdotransferase
LKTNISLEEAQSILTDKAMPTAEQNVYLLEAVGRVISKDIVAQENVPSFNRSPLDGYALLAEDTKTAAPNRPVKLKIIEELSPGNIAKKKVVAGTTIKVMTGSAIPEGANAIIKYEDVIKEGQFISICSLLKPGANIVRAGEDISRGQVVITRGNPITPPMVGVLASLGYSTIPVYTKPKVAIITTGDEIIDLNEDLSKGKLRNSNLYCLAAYCQALGAEPIIIGNVADQVESVSQAIARGLSAADLILITGGVSVGDNDPVKEAIKATGARELFWKVTMKPGSPTLAAIKDKKIVIGLSGNPASAVIAFYLMVVPVIKRLCGYEKYMWSQIEAKLANEFSKPSPIRRFLRGKMLAEDGTVKVVLTGKQANGVLTSLVGCNVLVDVPAGTGAIEAGENIKGYLISY